MPRFAFLAARRVYIADTICLDRDVLYESSISGAKHVPFPLFFLLLSSPFFHNHRIRPSRSRWNNRREGSEELGDYELGMTPYPTPHTSETLPFDFDQYARANPGRGDEVLCHTALSFSFLSRRPLESAEHHPSLRASCRLRPEISSVGQRSVTSGA